MLDLGCGIGWSAHELARHHPEARILGIDLSEVLVRTATQLFGGGRIQFRQQDLTEANALGGETFDNIVMLDVYEHIPAAERPDFHRSLAQALRPDGGRLILSCPTVHHQNYLRTHNPAGLQPVDEDLGAAEITALARDLGGEVIFFAYRQIWRRGDYFHAVIERNFRPDRPQPLYRDRVGALEPRPRRLRRVKRAGLYTPAVREQTRKTGLLYRLWGKLRGR